MTSDYQNPQFLSLLPDLTGEAGAECEIILPDYCPNVLRILQTTARPILRSEQTTGNRITVDGCVEYRVLYLAEDGSGMKSVTQQGHGRHAGRSAGAQRVGSGTESEKNFREILGGNHGAILQIRCDQSPVSAPALRSSGSSGAGNAPRRIGKKAAEDRR